MPAPAATASPATPSGSRLDARSEQRGTRAEQSMHEVGCSADHVFAVVEEQQASRSLAGSRHGVDGDCPGRSDPEGADDLLDDEPRSVIGASSTSHAPSRWPAATPAPTSSISRVLPVPPTPTSVTRRWPRGVRGPRQLPFATHEGGHLTPGGWMPVRTASEAAGSPEADRRPRAGRHVPGGRDRGDDVRPDRSVRPRRQPSASQFRGRPGYEDLAAVADREQPRDPVQRRTVEVSVPRFDAPG